MSKHGTAGLYGVGARAALPAAPLFGWRRPDGTRRFRTGHIEIPKKNGKSFLCSYFALYGLTKDNERAPEVYVAAGDFNSDGLVDLATANAGSNDVSILLNTGNDPGGNPTFAAAVPVAVGSSGGGKCPRWLDGV